MPSILHSSNVIELIGTLLARHDIVCLLVSPKIFGLQRKRVHSCEGSTSCWNISTCKQEERTPVRKLSFIQKSLQIDNILFDADVETSICKSPLPIDANRLFPTYFASSNESAIFSPLVLENLTKRDTYPGGNTSLFSELQDKRNNGSIANKNKTLLFIDLKFSYL